MSVDFCHLWPEIQNTPIQHHRHRHSPLWGWVRTVERILELNNISVFLFQLPVMLHVILHQLSQGGKLLPAVKVVVVSCVLDLNVGDGSISPAEGSQTLWGNVCLQGREQTPTGSATRVSSFNAYTDLSYGAHLHIRVLNSTIISVIIHKVHACEDITSCEIKRTYHEHLTLLQS